MQGLLNHRARLGALLLTIVCLTAAVGPSATHWIAA